MVKDAYPYLIPLLILTVLFWAFGSKPAATFFFIQSIFVVFFFRDPEREIPQDPSAIVSPADGKVVEIVGQADGTTKVSIFLSILNVHVNRAPVDGIVENIQYIPGKFKVAFDPSASVENERNILVIDHGSYKIRLSQIAGILARRIVCWKKAGDRVSKGERIGLIKFGSRVDLFLPEYITPLIKVGDKVKGGSTIVGRAENAQG
jgi:phosphatidylserine decarboxylase